MSAQPALFNDTAPRKKSASCWSADENQFAVLTMTTWNNVFKQLAGGYSVYDKRHNRFVAIQFHRRNCARPAAERFTDDDVTAAITAYATCPVNVKLSSWKRYVDWMREAEENIDHQLRRIGRPIGKTNGRYAAAVRVVENLGVGRFAQQANQESMALTEYLRGIKVRIDRMRHPRAADKATRAACLRLLALAARYKALDKTDRDALRARADTAFTALKGRSPMESGDDCTLCRAIILSLMDFDARRAVASRDNKETT
ncbi:MAG: hypothetical protein B6D36_19735 [Planctomycetes bacterium UTPLA1]|nr:MAG: hypothetical protein B6D36_19735 [Planctomycetes bacterium UTPLA1]